MSYGFSALRDAAWLRHCDVFYWGDLDTYSTTLLAHLQLWGREPKPSRVQLTKLEQEHIDWDWALQRVLHESPHKSAEGSIPGPPAVSSLNDDSDDQGGFMRTTVVLDDALLSKAQELSGIQERSALLREALTALVARESSLRLARLGGSDPEAAAAPRRRSA